MIYYFLSLIIILVTLINYKRGFLLFLIYQLFWLGDLLILNTSGLPKLKMKFFMSMFFCVFYIVKGYRNKKTKLQCPFMKPFIVITFSYAVTTFVSIGGFFQEFLSVITIVLYWCVLSIIAWNIIEEKKDFVFLFKGISIVIFIAGIYGIYEYIFKSNPLLAYKDLFLTKSLTISYTTRRGFMGMSIFNHPAAAGIFFATYIVFVFSLYAKKVIIPYKNLVFINVLLSIVCIYFTQSRAPILFFMIYALCLFDLTKYKTYRVLLMILCLIVFALFFFANKFSVLLSIFDVNLGDKVGGSSVSQRLGQLYMSFYVAKDSFILGLGRRYFDGFRAGSLNEMAAGFESVWFRQLIANGLVGVIAYLYVFYYTIMHIAKRFRSKYILFLVLAYWVVYSLSLMPEFIIYHIIIFYYIKTSKNYLSLK